MLDPMVSLALAVYSNKGVYALLLGSGISRSSGIPTGWEVVLDLVRKVAVLEEEDCEPDPTAWFRAKHGEEPDYSKLLDQIAKTSPERQQLLRGYFEPTEDERAQNLKVPTLAHRAIARLVAAGYLRVIVTTNFDRLTERALEEADITPTIISSPDQVSGALPLVHSGPTVIKLHGDYLDTRIKNTGTELETYDPAFNVLLDRVFDEYGLIISGWSGDWDAALRASMMRAPNRRFTTFWTTKGPLGIKAQDLATHRRAEVVQVSDADRLFASLEEKVSALQSLDTAHPLSASIAVATLKRYLADPSAKIRIHDLIHDEAQKVIVGIKAPSFIPIQQIASGEVLAEQLRKYEKLCEILLATMITLGYWGDERTQSTWLSCLHQIANPHDSSEAGRQRLGLRWYPSLLLLYGVGIAAIAASNYKNFAALLTEAQVRTSEGEEPFGLVVYPVSVISKEAAKELPGLGGHWTPLNDYLFGVLREPLRGFLPRDEDYKRAFDRFEYLFGMAHADIRECEKRRGWWGPVGCFAWRYSRGNASEGPQNQVGIELGRLAMEWPPLTAGLFGKSLERANLAKHEYDKFLSDLGFS